MSRSKIYRIPWQNHLVRIQDLQDPNTKQKCRIQDLQDPTAKTIHEDPGSPGSHNETKIYDPRSAGSKIPRIPRQKNFKYARSVGSHNKMNVPGTRTTRSHNKMPRAPSTGFDRKKDKIYYANFMKIVPNPMDVSLSTWQFSYASRLN